jgi:hypothetical protein
MSVAMHVNPAHTIRRAVVTAAIAAAWTTSAAAQAVLPLAGAESFVVLTESTVANANASTFGGDVGVAPGAGHTISGITAGMLAAGSALHQGDAVAAQALHSARLVYADLAARTTCTATNPPLNVPLQGGTYCFDGDALVTGAVVLDGTGPWIFLVDGALVVDPTAVVTVPFAAPNTCGGSAVYWQVGDSSTTTLPTAVTVGAGARMAGTILAEGAITFGAGAALDGRAVSLGTATTPGSVTLDTNAVAACSAGKALPTHTAFKVTGGGGINVPNNPATTDPEATGTGFANYGFNGQPGGAGAPATGNFNYVNHVVAGNLHINGPVTDVDVVALNTDGTPKTARLSGTCDGFLPTCTFSVLTEDNGEPPFDDKFGVTIVSAGAVVEARSLRLIRNGNIQFHSATLSTTVNAPALKVGQTMRVAARLRKDKTRTAADAYVVLQLPNGQLLSWTGGGFAAGIVPIARNIVPVDLDLEVLALQIPPGTPPGLYKWLSALTQAGTMNLLTGIAERPFTIVP